MYYKQTVFSSVQYFIALYNDRVHKRFVHIFLLKFGSAEKRFCITFLLDSKLCREASYDFDLLFEDTLLHKEFTCTIIRMFSKKGKITTQ